MMFENFKGFDVDDMIFGTTEPRDWVMERRSMA